MRKVVISGIGLVTPGKCEKEDVWQYLINKENLFQRKTFNEQDQIVIGRLPEYDLEHYQLIEKKKFRYLDKQVLYTLIATIKALRDAGLETLVQNKVINLEKVGAVMGSMTAQMEFGLEQVKKVVNEKSFRISPMTGVAFYFGASVGEISVMLKTKGENCAVLSGSSASIDGVMVASDMIKRGHNNVVFVGAGENIVFEVFFNAFNHYQKMAQNNYIPYDVKREGCFLSNGGGVVVIENAIHAEQRNAPIYGEVLSYHTLNAAQCFFKINEQLTTYTEKVIDKCLKESGLNTDEIDLVIPTAEGSVDGDYYEMLAIRNIFRGKKKFVYSPKLVLGHCLSFNTIVDIFVGIMVMKNNVIPGHPIKINSPDPEFNDMLIGESPVTKPVKNVLILHHNFTDSKISSLIVSKYNH